MLLLSPHEERPLAVGQEQVLFMGQEGEGVRATEVLLDSETFFSLFQFHRLVGKSFVEEVHVGRSQEICDLHQLDGDPLLPLTHLRLQAEAGGGEIILAAQSEDLHLTRRVLSPVLARREVIVLGTEENNVVNNIIGELDGRPLDTAGLGGEVGEVGGAVGVGTALVYHARLGGVGPAHQVRDAGGVWAVLREGLAGAGLGNTFSLERPPQSGNKTSLISLLNSPPRLMSVLTMSKYSKPPENSP